MFVLTKDEEKFVLLPVKKIYTVGRLATDLIVSQDLSISRNHVQLVLPGDGDDDTLQMEDLGSRYGTFIFNRNSTRPRKVNSKTMTPLPVGIRVRFGANLSVWQVTRLKLVTSVSALTRHEIEELAEMVKPMSGIISSNWTSECSHLTMNEASVTVKLLHAMLDNKPIVTFAYWKKLLQAAQSIHVKEGWPQPEDYQPTNMDVTWRPERTRLFAGKIFIFMNRKHFEMYGSVVQKAGASCKDINSGVRKTFLTKSDVIVIQYVPSTQSQATESINSIQDVLEQSGRRIIQEYEIGMALIHCSIKEFCNPAHKFIISDSMPTTESVTSSMAFNSSIIVPNTERSSAQSSGPVISELVVPESEACDVAQEVSKHISEPQTSTNSVRKRGHAIIVDSSDEDQNAASSKRSKPVSTAKEVNKNAKSSTLMDSSEKEEAVKPPAPVPGSNQRITRRSKVICDEKTVEPTVLAPNKHKAETVKPVYCIDSSDEENKNSEEPKEAKAPVINIPSKKNPEVSGVTRISPRLNTKSVATNITNKPTEKMSIPAKGPVLPVAVDDEDDNEDLFQFRKTPKKSSEAAVTQSVGKEKLSARISVINFLEKSQPQEPTPPVSSQSQTQPRKRLHLEVLSESDSDDCENPFNFADSKRKKKEQNMEDSTDGLFNFNSERPSSAVDQDSVLTEPFLPELDKKNKSKYIVVQRKELPKKVDISGWLSCSRLHDDVKHEAYSDRQVKLESSIKADPDEEKWLAAMQDNIQVRMCQMNIVNRTEKDLDASLQDSVSKYGGRKNFKKFVKTNNPHPQKRIVALKSLKLVDGMVTCL
ncbi:nibrin [Drosophila eugracilis]|uniref:nibrin n=1 Tax=Drosophila eugracilis TaxID=29029 RepID=UPI001BDAC0C4|nr:nibrin [Drosophila eugracilis]